MVAEAGGASGRRALPIACNLSALGPEEREERSRLAAALSEGIVKVIELPDGYAVELDPRSVIAARLEEFMRLERACCPFLEFGARPAEAPGGSPTLVVTGAEGAKAFLKLQFGLGTA